MKVSEQNFESDKPPSNEYLKNKLDPGLRLVGCEILNDIVN